MRNSQFGFFSLFCFAMLLNTAEAAPVACPAGVDPAASRATTAAEAVSDCSTRTSHGYLLPDRKCTPGAVNPTVTLEVLRAGDFKTGCERNVASSAALKNKTYQAYSIAHPSQNTGKHQTCELDHLVSLELGGADTVDNIWPQCGPKGVVLAKRHFKIKDSVENYLAAQVRAGGMSLKEAQEGIAENWTTYVADAKKYFKSHSKKGFGSDQ